MDKSITSLYLYDDVRRLLMRTDPTTYDNLMDNAPMYKRPIKIHKGIDNNLVFRVFSPDRKPVSLCNREMYARLINKETREVVLEKKIWHGEQAGFIKIRMNPHDLAGVGIGSYTMTILQESEFVHGVGGDPTYSAIFTDFESNATIEVEVTDQVEVRPVPSHQIDPSKMSERRRYQDGDGYYESVFYSDAIMGTRLKNHSNGLITFSTKSTGFTGKLQVYATLDHTPNPDIDRGWFVADLENDDNVITYIDYHGTRYFNLRGNYMWIKIVIIPLDYDEMTKMDSVIVRT